MNSKLTALIYKAFNKHLVVFCFLPMFLVSVSCKDEGDREKKVYEPFRLVNLIPRFSVQPRINNVEKDSFSLMFALDKSSKVAVYVLESQDSNNQLIKSNLDVFNIGGQDKNKGRFFEMELARHIRRELVFKGLKPDFEYRIFIASVDASAEDFFFTMVQKTLPDAKEVQFFGEPTLALQGVAWEFKPTLSEDVDGIVLDNAPKWLRWDALSRSLKGVPEFSSKSRNAGELEEVVKIKLKVDQEGFVGEHELSLKVAGDPLVEHAWHLQNKGQRAFAWLPAKSDFDSFVAPVIAQGITGKGVEVHIIDSGLQVDHPDLKNNVNEAFNRNLSKSEGANIAGPDDPKPLAIRGGRGDHGTSVAGIIAASGWNGIGSRGVAPNAKISATRIDFSNEEDDISSPSLIRAMDFENPKRIQPDIVNMSLGPRVSKLNQNLVLGAASAGFKIGEDGELEFEDRDDLCYSNTRYYQATLKSAVSGRNKKGVIFVKAAGNGGDSPTLRNPDDANFDPLNTLPWHIVVGAVNASGVKASYSTPGSSLWVSAPAGEYGWQGDPSRIYVDTPKWTIKPVDPNAEPPQEFVEYELKYTQELAPLSRFTPAIITTDQTYTGSEGQDLLKPCEFGYARSYEFYEPKPEHLEKGAGASGFNLGYHPENLNCDYTATMNGTSAAAPFVAGVIALMLEKNPDLTWRDVKHILASTSQKIDANIGDEEIAVGSPSSRFIRTYGWKRNNAGYNFHNYYGFGLVNAEAAVKMADPLTYQLLPPNISFVENAEVLSCEGFDSLDEDNNAPVEEGEPNPFGNFWEFTRFDGAGSIPQNSTEGVKKTVKVNKNVIIEAITIQVNINGENMSHIGIEVTSPSGMSNMILPPVNSADYKNFNNMVFTSNAFYGEKSAGQWTVKFVDAKASAIANATVNEVSMRIWGYRE